MNISPNATRTKINFMFNLLFAKERLAAKEITNIPIIVDPSHSTFNREFVPAVSRAACAIGADGIIIDVHPDPENAAVDPLNAITFDNFSILMNDLRGISKIVGKKIN